MLTGTQSLQQETIYAAQYAGQIVTVKVSGDVFEPHHRAQRDNLLEQLVQLKSIGIHPVLVHGGNGQIGRAVTAAGFTRVQDDHGNYISSDADIAPAYEAIETLNREICTALDALLDGRGVPARAMGMADFGGAAPVTAQKLVQRTGVVGAIDGAALKQAVTAGAIPVLHSFAPDAAGAIHNINADNVACDAAIASGSKRLIFLSKENGVLGKDGQTLSVLTPDAARQYIAGGVITGGMKKKVTQMAAVADRISGVVTLNAAEENGIWKELMSPQGAATATLVTNDIQSFFQASVTAPHELKPADKLGFLGLQAQADMHNVWYVKEKSLRDLANGAYLAMVRRGPHLPVGQCLLTDRGNPDAAYVAGYPQHGQTLVLTTLFVNAGHSSIKGAVRKGMGPVSQLFNAVDLFAQKHGYDSIVAKTNAANAEGRALFEKMGYTASQQAVCGTDSYESVYYTKKFTP